MKSSRRAFLQSGALLALSLTTRGSFAAGLSGPLAEYGYPQIELAPGLHEAQLEHSLAVLMALEEDSLLKPFRGPDSPGVDLEGWYSSDGFAPAHCFGQWVSALYRANAIRPDAAVRAKAERLLRLYAATIGPDFYRTLRYPAYTYDKLVLALIDAHKLGGFKEAFPILERTTEAALPSLPSRALNRDEYGALPHKDISYTWDESYTLPENLFLAYQRGAGSRYLAMARRYLKDDTFFTPLSEGRNVLPGNHAYSYANSLSSAVQAYLVGGSHKHLRAAVNAFDFLERTQSFATGGWGPDERFREPGQGELGASLRESHKSFETPCGSYAHFKLARALLRITRDPRYGDSIEKVMYNTVLGARPLQADGSAFYYSDYNFAAQKVYFNDKWPCCAGTLPQVATDYRLNCYLRSPEGPWVNLYVPSTLRWQQDGANVALEQSGNYPLDGHIAFRMQCDRECDFALKLRIPSWAAGARVAVNGASVSAEAGTFHSLARTWRNGDRVDLELPLPMRLQAVDPEHPDTVALLRGPLVLFGLTHDPTGLTREQLLGATRHGDEWRVDGLRLLPFTAIHDEPYTTYYEVRKA